MNSIHRPRAWARTLGIPPVLWQTYLTKDLQGQAAICRESWARMNTQWDKRLHDDDEIAAMMEEGFPPEVARVFRELPMGVMKADMWRYAVLYLRGGLYADVDCRCRQSINEWEILPPDLAGKGRKAWLVVGVENHVHFCNWAFAGTAGHPALERTLDFIVSRFQKGIDFSYEHFVHEHTGPGVWTDAILDYLETKAGPKEIHHDPELMAAARDKGVLILDERAFSSRLCFHEHASEMYGEGWQSWTRQRRELVSGR